jgi:uncharacterized protein (DUF2336 family)
MIVRAYLEWSLNASAAERAEAAGMLAQLFLEGQLAEDAKRDAEAALLLALDDPSPLVRRMLAEKLGGSDRAPRALIATLSQDVSDIAGLVIANSPLLADAALVDLLALGDSTTQCAVASRLLLSAPVAAALCEVGVIEAVRLLIDNPGASIPVFALRRLIARFQSDGGLREALLARGDLPADLRMAMVQGATQQLARFVEDCGWLSPTRAQRLAQDCAESGLVVVAAASGDDELECFVRALRDSGALTPQLLLRSLLSGDTPFLAAALAALAGVAMAKASSLVHGRSESGFRALYRKAGLPHRLAPAFEAAIAAWHDCGRPLASGALSRSMVERVLTSVAALEDRELDRLMALLIRYQAEAAREEARLAIAEMMSEASQTIEVAPPDLEHRLQDALQLELRTAA